MEELVKLFIAAIKEGADASPVNRLTEAYQYSVSFPETSEFESLQTEVLPYLEGGTWFSLDKDPAMIRHITTAAIRAYDSELTEGLEMQQLVVDGDMVLFYLGYQRAIRLSVKPAVKIVDDSATED